MIVANPPYLPARAHELPPSGAERAWEARAATGARCSTGSVRRRRATWRPAGVLLVVHSSLCGTDSTLDRLREQGLRADVAVRHHGSLGPLMRARAAELEAATSWPPASARRRSSSCAPRPR